jgi:Lon protease-like protein
MELDALPMFPLHAVVFPGLPVQLHVFEERYKALVADALLHDRQFGVVAIASGQEVGGDAEPYNIGTLVRIASVDRLENGRLNLVATAEERIRLLSFDRDGKPYLRARVALWPDEDHPPASRQEVDELRHTFNEYVAAILREVGSSAEEIARRVPLKLPGDPLTVSIVVAGMMQVPLNEKQDLLAAPSSGERIRLAQRLLGRELVLLRSAHAGPALRPHSTSDMFSSN